MLPRPDSCINFEARRSTRFIRTPQKRTVTPITALLSLALAATLAVPAGSSLGDALGRARPGDTVVIAGKGHEQGQELTGGRKVPFDDREVAREALDLRARGGA
jgi:hypothetical protein